MLMNQARAAWAATAMKAFVDATGSEKEDAVADFLCDLAHLIGPDQLAEEIRRADEHYQEEIDTEADMEYHRTGETEELALLVWENVE